MDQTVRGFGLKERSSHLRSNPHGLMEVGGSNRQNHELLHGQFVSSVTAPVDHVEGLQTP